MQLNRTLLALILTGVVAEQCAWAGTVNWTYWTSQAPNTVSGSLMVGSTPVGVTYSGSYSFAQLNNNGTNFWVPAAPYLSSTVSNAPFGTGIITLNSAGTSTITFSTPVVNPLIALVSWNGANVMFGGGGDTQPYNIQYLSSGCGYWGCGSFSNTTPSSFSGSGELHGVIELVGTYQTITFTDTVSEYWHGLTVGVAGGLGHISEPAPATVTFSTAPVAPAPVAPAPVAPVNKPINAEKTTVKETHVVEDPCSNEEPGVYKRECQAMDEMDKDINKLKNNK